MVSFKVVEMLLLLGRSVSRQMPVAVLLHQRVIPKVVSFQMLEEPNFLHPQILTNQSCRWVLIQMLVLELWNQSYLTVIRILLTERQMLESR